MWVKKILFRHCESSTRKSFRKIGNINQAASGINFKAIKTILMVILAEEMARDRTGIVAHDQFNHRLKDFMRSMILDLKSSNISLIEELHEILYSKMRDIHRIIKEVEVAAIIVMGGMS